LLKQQHVRRQANINKELLNKDYTLKNVKKMDEDTEAQLFPEGKTDLPTNSEIADKQNTDPLIVSQLDYLDFVNINHKLDYSNKNLNFNEDQAFDILVEFVDVYETKLRKKDGSIGRKNISSNSDKVFIAKILKSLKIDVPIPNITLSSVKNVITDLNKKKSS
jgi:hypothetical protein